MDTQSLKKPGDVKNQNKTKNHHGLKDCLSSEKSSLMDQQSLEKTGDVGEKTTTVKGKIAFPASDPVRWTNSPWKELVILEKNP